MTLIRLIKQPNERARSSDGHVINLLTITFKQASRSLSRHFYARWHQLKVAFLFFFPPQNLVLFALFVKSARLQLPSWPNPPGHGGLRQRERQERKEKQHLRGNNYLSHPPQPPDGELSRDAWQFAAQLSKIAQTSSLVSPSVTCWQSFDYLQQPLSAAQLCPQRHGRWVWKASASNTGQSLQAASNGGHCYSALQQEESVCG